MRLLTPVELLAGALARLRSTIRGVANRSGFEADMNEEFRHHIELRTEDLIAGGVSPEEALRRARLDFGQLETQKERARVAKGLRPFDQLRFSWIDTKLGLRMAAKYPLMSVVSGLAIAVTIAMAVGMFSYFQDFLLRPSVPLHEGDRVVSLGLRTTDSNRTYRSLLHEFDAWKNELQAVENVGLWRREERNILGEDGRAELIPFALMSPVGFTVARVPPLLGRPLLESDGIPGAPRVVVIGYEEWVGRYDADPTVIGTPMRIGRELHTIVGVMPEGFAFPYAEGMWLPLQDEASKFPVDRSPCCYFAFGRLAPGATLEGAQAEMTVLTERRVLSRAQSHPPVRGQVMPYTDTHTGMDDVNPGDMWIVRAVLTVASLLAFLPFANVAILTYARTATRAGEIAVRTALGASRRRVVMQLFAEALVLAGIAAAVGVAFTLLILTRIDQYMQGFFGAGMPFWARNGLDPWAIAYATALTLLAAVVAGVIPGLQATGKAVSANIKRAGSGNGMRLGAGWTALVVLQVTVTVAILPFAGSIAWQAIGLRISQPTFAADEYLSALIARPVGEVIMPDSASSTINPITEVVRRLEADSRVGGLTLSTESPSALYSVAFSDFDRIEVDGLETPAGGHRVGSTAVEPGFFEFLGVPVVDGREFVSADLTGEAFPVVVNPAFATRVLGGANPIGRYIREVKAPDGEPRPWRVIVGVAEDLQVNPVHPEAAEPRIFSPLDRSRLNAAYVTLRPQSNLRGLIPIVHQTAMGVDPSLRLARIAPLSQPDDPMRALMAGVATGIGLVLLSILLLCTAGVFSLMSCSVTQRRREIGIRSALGGKPRRVLVSVIARTAKQLAAGVAGGLLLFSLLPEFSFDGLPMYRDPRLIAAVAVTMIAIGVVAAVGPARRGLRIQPTEALKEG